MENERVYLVGCILKGMAQNKVYFGMAEDALAIADAVIAQMKETTTETSALQLHDNREPYSVS